MLNCCVVIKGNAFPALVPALTSDTDEELRGYFRINHSHLKNSENNTFLLILKKILSSLVKITQQNRLRMCSGVFHDYFFFHCSFFSLSLYFTV